MNLFKKNNGPNYENKIRYLTNRIWKLERPPKFKTNETASTYFDTSISKVKIVNEQFSYDNNGYITSRSYLVIVDCGNESYTTTVSEYSIFPLKTK